jgi:hypothetical protein
MLDSKEQLVAGFLALATAPVTVFAEHLRNYRKSRVGDIHSGTRIVYSVVFVIQAI